MSGFFSGHRCGLKDGKAGLELELGPVGKVPSTGQLHRDALLFSWWWVYRVNYVCFCGLVHLWINLLPIFKPIYGISNVHNDCAM